MELRAHHLLCIQGYHGVGYSPEFVENMNRVVDRLEENPKQQVEIVTRCDALCRACPGKGEDGICTSQELVEKLDQKTLKWMHINEGFYEYGKLAQYVKENLDWNSYCEICSQCEWFKNNVCALKEKFQI